MSLFLQLMSDKVIIRPEDLYDPSPNAYSHAVKTGNTVYVAGQMAVDKSMRIVGVGDIAAQTRQVFGNIEKTLVAVGAGLGDIVSMTVFLRDMRDLRTFVRTRREIFERDFPASTAVQVAGFADPEGLVEVNAVAVVGRSKRRKASGTRR